MFHAAYTSGVAQVKGSALASRILWVELGHGDAGVSRLLHQCTPGLRSSLDDGIAKAKWYPFEQFVELNVTIDRLFGNGDLALVRELGRAGADATLTTIYRLFYKLGSVQWILARGVRLWSAHYDSGVCEVATRGAKGAVIRVVGFATPHRAHCLSVIGWIERSIELSGGRRPVIDESKCRTRGDDCCQLDIVWQ
jgi:hypothetical protein